MDVSSTFEGYANLDFQSTVNAVVKGGESLGQANTEEQAALVLDHSPFYAESGGQVGDRGELKVGKSCFEVHDTRRVGNAIVHYGVVTEGTITVGDVVSARVDESRRRAIARNHSATHLLHAALRNVLGEHVNQKGSLVEQDRLRFDFSHFEPMTAEEVVAIEDQVNAWVLGNNKVTTRLMALEDAKKSGAMALFGEKYDDPVRVLAIGDYSVELCGGTHVSRSGDVGLFKIVSETGVAAGVRRIEALTGTGALKWVADTDARLSRIAGVLKAERDGVDVKVDQLVARARDLEKEVERLKGKLAASEGDDLVQRAVDVDGLKVLAAKLEGVDPKGLREIVDQLKNKLGSAAVVVATVSDEKVSLVAGVTKDWTDRIAAGPLANHVAQQVGGRGGGRPDMAQAGGSEPEKLDQAIDSVTDWVRQQLNG